MTGSFNCCFCGNEISEADAHAVELIGQNLWKSGRDEAAQAVYAHSKCSAEAMAAGQFTPSALVDKQKGYSLQEILWGEHRGERIAIPRWGCVTLGCLAILAIVALVVR